MYASDYTARAIREFDHARRANAAAERPCPWCGETVPARELEYRCPVCWMATET